MRQKLALRDVTRDVYVAGLGSERRRVAVRADGHDDAHAELTKCFDDGRQRFIVAEDRAERDVDERRRLRRGDPVGEWFVATGGEGLRAQVLRRWNMRTFCGLQARRID